MNDPITDHPLSSITDQQASTITRVEELAYVLRVREVMTRELETLSPSQKMSDVLDLFRIKQISGAPVLFNSDLIGIISLEDLIQALTNQDLEASVAKYMSTRVYTAHDFDPVVEALKIFNKCHVGRLPVVDQKGALVGMITKGDITNGVLRALRKDYQVEEVRRYRARHLFEDIVSDRTSLILRYRIEKGDFIHGGNASSNIKRALLRLGANPQIARRCGIAIYEAEMNLIIHTNEGGMIKVEIEPHRIYMQAIDDGPGIADTDLAMQAGYSTASETVREMGFGAGMGLYNISRCVDKINLQSEPGKGTRLEMKIYLQPQDTVGEIHHPGE